MSNTRPKKTSASPPAQPVWLRALGIIIPLVGAFYSFVWLYLDPWSRYCASAPVFRFGSDFFGPYLKRPGGLLEYAAAFLAQSEYHPWLGALTFTLLTVVLSLGTSLLLRQTGGKLGWAWAIPGFLLLVLYGQYLPPITEISCRVLLGVAALLCYLAWPMDARLAKIAFFALLTSALFYVAGPFPSLLFIVAGGLFEMLCRQDGRSALGCWFWVLPWCLAAVAWGEMDLGLTTRRWGSQSAVVMVGVLYFSFPVLLGLGGLTARWRHAEGDPRTDGSSKHTARSDHRAPPATTAWFGLAPVGLVLLAGLIFVLTFSPERRTSLRLQAAAERQNWNEVVVAGRRLKVPTVADRLQSNRALYHLGRLNDDLFTFPQRSGDDLLASLSDGLQVCVPLSDTLLELGQVNLAEHYAHEAVEVRGERPELLWRLAWINLVKERPKAARVFLGALNKVPFQRARAERWLRALDQDPTLTGEEEVRQARALRVTSDVVERRFPTEELLRQALQSNRKNRMALEYLMAHFLLTQQADQVVQNVGRWEEAGGATLPRHVTEAVLAFAQNDSAKAVDLRGRTMAPEIVRRFELFRSELRRQGEERAAFDLGFAQTFGDTFWFFDVFGRSSPPKTRRFPVP